MSTFASKPLQSDVTMAICSMLQFKGRNYQTCRPNFHCNNKLTNEREEHKRTVSVFQGLLLFGGLGDDFDPLAEEDADVCAVAVEHLDRQHEVLSLVGVGYVQGFGCAIILQAVGGGRGRNKYR